MKRLIILRCVWLCLAAVVVSSLVSASILQMSKERDVEHNMRDILQAMALTQKVSTSADYNELARAYNSISFDYRITILDVAGRVLGDSKADQEEMQNHAQRPEIRQAVAAGYGSEKRFSKTMNQSMLYVALRDGDFIYRIASPLSNVHATYAEVVPALLAGLVVTLAVSPFLAGSVARSVTKPISATMDALQTLAEGGGEVKPMPPQFDELQPVADTINALSFSISETMRELSDQKEKTEYLLDNMLDGLVLVDRELRILQVNATARRLLGEGKGETGQNLLLLTRQPRLLDAVKRAVEAGVSSLFDLDRSHELGMVLSIHVSAIRSEWLAHGKESGAVILITDVTQERNAQRLRSEFVANASHELKTPITSIGGFAELLAAGVVTEPAQVRDYLGRIQSETTRMSALIDDILRLSRLEAEPEQTEQGELVEMRKLLTELVANLQPQLEQQQVTLVVKAEDLLIQADPVDMAALVGNLLDNAVKYNKPKGSVEVTLRRVGGCARFTVQDTGIGIPADQQPRIFERFYRVDKGRSRKIGGTGLGLSIVKHVAAKYQGDLFLQSEEGVGTAISVDLPLAGIQERTPDNLQ